MRNAFIKTLEQEAAKNKKIILLTGDLGFTVFENFKKRFPKRFFNMGVAEANMLGVATGLALSGKIPIVYSIVPFITLRPFEQIRNDVCMHNANVKIVGVGGGLAYTHAGPTHHIAEDFAVMRVLPNMTVISPADPIEVKLAVSQMLKKRGPVYLRLGKAGERNIHKKIPVFSIGKGILLKDGRDILIISCGSILENAVNSAANLEKLGYSTAVISMHTVKPLDTEILDKMMLRRFKAIFTVEEHNILGGLGGAIAEHLLETNIKQKPIFKRIGIKDEFCLEIGDYEYMRDYYSLSTNKITQIITRTVANI